MVQAARDEAKLNEAKRMGLNIKDPRKFQLQIKALGNNVSQVVA